ncbi:hypothetical protein ABEB36_012249 [Hypothenemus hampei]|uniref:Nose resistant-to-fluoxetine protein N-terminal domain-containing protein n=1 Tax=Hypothenemus hampei TaxID=57062 RepID=A0ABD1EAL2_HYPHA
MFINIVIVVLTSVLIHAEFRHETLLNANNGKCVAQIKLFLANFFDPTGDDLWALTMIDATAKIPSGILELNWVWPGNFDECLSISSNKTGVKGNYCVVTFSMDADSSDFLENVIQRPIGVREIPILPSMGVCVPNQCKAEDLESVLSMTTKDLHWNVVCQTKDSLDSEVKGFDIAVITFFASIIIVMMFSTLYDYAATRNYSEEPHAIVKAFSIKFNGQRLFKTSKAPGEFSSLNGIRFLSLMWIISYSNMTVVYSSPVSNILDLIDYFSSWKSLIFANATFAMDTFLVVTGMLVFYNYFKSQHQGLKFNIFQYYRHRYLRLTSALIPVVLICIVLPDFIGSGPYHPELDSAIGKPCRRFWWTKLLHVQNYVTDYSNFCVSQTWHVDMDWQLYFVSPIFLWILTKKPKIGVPILVAIVLASMGFDYYITWVKELPSTNFNGHIHDYNKHYYFNTHNRVSPWIIGGLLGFLLSKVKLNGDLHYVNFNKWFLRFIWPTVFAILVACVFAGSSAQTSQTYHPYFNAFFNAFARTAWALCIAWIILACSTGFGGIINSILSWNLFQILNRFSYSMYLIHLPILYCMVHSLKQPYYFTVFDLMYSYWGFITTTFLISIFWVLAFEMPIATIESYIFRIPSVKRSARAKTSP